MSIIDSQPASFSASSQSSVSGGAISTQTGMSTACLKARTAAMSCFAPLSGVRRVPPPKDISAAGFSSRAAFATSMMGSILRHSVLLSIFIEQNWHSCPP